MRSGGESVVIRQRLDAKGGDPGKAWFVQATRMLRMADFERLVGRA